MRRLGILNRGLRKAKRLRPNNRTRISAWTTRDMFAVRISALLDRIVDLDRQSDFEMVLNGKR